MQPRLVYGVSSAVEFTNRGQMCSALDQLNDAVQEIAEEHSDLSDLQKACLVKCITSNYLSYTTDFPEQMIGTACGAARSGRTNCKGFAALADYLLDQLDVRSNSIASVTHAFNRLRYNNRWYIFEPQANGCEFFVD